MLTREARRRFRHRDQRLAQPVLRQRHQVLRRGRREALGRRSRKRSRPISTSPPVTRESRALGQAKTASTRRACEYMEFCKSTIPAGMGFEEFKIVVDASHGAGLQSRAARHRPISAPTSCPSAARRTAATSTTAAARRGPDLLQAHGHRRARRMSVSRSTATATASSWSMSAAISSTATSCCTSSPAIAAQREASARARSSARS